MSNQQTSTPILGNDAPSLVTPRATPYPVFSETPTPKKTQEQYFNNYDTSRVVANEQAEADYQSTPCTDGGVYHGVWMQRPKEYVQRGETEGGNEYGHQYIDHAQAAFKAVPHGGYYDDLMQQTNGGEYYDQNIQQQNNQIDQPFFNQKVQDFDGDTYIAPTNIVQNDIPTNIPSNQQSNVAYNEDILQNYKVSYTGHNQPATMEHLHLENIESKPNRTMQEEFLSTPGE